jgi:hypothetical protein
MTAPALRSLARTSAYYALDPDEDYAPGELASGERICPPRAGTGGNSMLRAYIVIFFALGSGWALLGNQATWQGWLRALTAAVSPSTDRGTPGSVEQTASAVAPAMPPANIEPTSKPAVIDPPPSTPQPLHSSEIATAPGAAAGTAASPLTTAAIPPATSDSDEAPAQPLPPPTVDPSDPYQKRAAAVGLHPDLSRVLLARLSPTDYRNAGIAIQTAVAKTPDTAVFVWPRQRKPELALFQVHFVQGAAPNCRRYVVTVTKDGWSTTALPMEKCGTSLVRRTANGASVE